MKMSYELKALYSYMLVYGYQSKSYMLDTTLWVELRKPGSDENVFFRLPRYGAKDLLLIVYDAIQMTNGV